MSNVIYTKQNKTNQLSCFVTDEEKERIGDLAKAEERTISNYIRTKLFLKEI